MITLKDLVEKLGLEVKTGKNVLDKPIIWVTLQIHQNIVAVAVLKELSGIVLVSGREPDKETIEKAEEEGIFIASSSLPSFELIGRMHGLGITGVP